MATSTQLRQQILAGAGRGPCRVVWYRPGSVGPAAAAIRRRAGTVRTLFRAGAAGASLLRAGAGGAWGQPHRPPARLRAGGGGDARPCGRGVAQRGRLHPGKIPWFNKLDVIDLSEAEPQDGESTHSASLIRGIAEGASGPRARPSAASTPTPPAMCCGVRPVQLGGIRDGDGGDPEREYHCGLSAPELAKICQYAENTYFGKPSGLLDQLTSAVGGVIFADFADPASPRSRRSMRRAAASRNDPLRDRHAGQPQRADRRVCGHPEGDGGCGGASWGRRSSVRCRRRISGPPCPGCGRRAGTAPCCGPSTILRSKRPHPRRAGCAAGGGLSCLSSADRAVRTRILHPLPERLLRRRCAASGTLLGVGVEPASAGRAGRCVADAGRRLCGHHPSLRPTGAGAELP